MLHTKCDYSRLSVPQFLYCVASCFVFPICQQSCPLLVRMLLFALSCLFQSKQKLLDFPILYVFLVCTSLMDSKVFIRLDFASVFLSSLFCVHTSRLPSPGAGAQSQTWDRKRTNCMHYRHPHSELQPLKTIESFRAPSIAILTAPCESKTRAWRRRTNDMSCVADHWHQEHVVQNKCPGRLVDGAKSSRMLMRPLRETSQTRDRANLSRNCRSMFTPCCSHPA